MWIDCYLGYQLWLCSAVGAMRVHLLFGYKSEVVTYWPCGKAQ